MIDATRISEKQAMAKVAVISNLARARDARQYC
jgi:hypothetical protein